MRWPKLWVYCLWSWCPSPFLLRYSSATVISVQLLQPTHYALESFSKLYISKKCHDQALLHRMFMNHVTSKIKITPKNQPRDITDLAITQLLPQILSSLNPCYSELYDCMTMRCEYEILKLKSYRGATKNLPFLIWKEFLNRNFGQCLYHLFLCLTGGFPLLSRKVVVTNSTC